MNNQYSNYGSPLYGNDFVTPNQYTAPKAESYRTEQSYIENILRLNRGKMVRIHMTFPDSVEFRDREFTGIIEQSGRDHGRGGLGAQHLRGLPRALLPPSGSGKERRGLGSEVDCLRQRLCGRQGADREARLRVRHHGQGRLRLSGDRGPRQVRPVRL